MRILGRIITVVIAVVVTIVVLAAGYMVYLNVNSKRLPDKAELTVTEVAESGETFEVGEASDSGETSDADEASENRETSDSDETSESSEPSDPGEDDQADSDILPKLRTEREYRALTYNVGFGAYNHGYSFFMSEGRIAGGGSTKGLMSRADSENSVEKNMEAAIAAMVGQRPDIAIFQEVDKKAGRSYKVDEFKMISRAFGEGILKDDDDVASRNTDGIGENIRDLSDVDDDEDEAVASGGPFAEAYATNFHTGWLLWPPAHPIGMISDSGIATYSRYAVASAERRSLPVVESFPAKYFDLDRCFMITGLPVDSADSATGTGGGEGEGANSGSAGDGATGTGSNPDPDTATEGDEPADAELVLINVHLSAYESGSRIRGEQMQKLVDVMKDEREKGNWVIVGGDWNQCFPDSVDAFPGRMETPAWAKPLDEDVLPDSFSIVNANNAHIIATCRDSSIPWTPGVSYETIVDGWIVSDNVDATADNIDTDYIASDHNPVLLTFTLR